MAATERKQVRRSTVVLLFLGMGVALGVTLASIAPVPDERQTIEWLDNPRSLGEFDLEADTGKYDNHSLVGHWTIVLFGFLHCPDICPTSLSQLASLADDFAEKSIDQDLAYVFVSVDPGRDSVSEIGQYVQHFDSSIRGVTGKAEQLARFAGDLGVQFKVSAASDEYAVAHSITFSIIGPEGALRGRFRPGFDVSDLTKNFVSKLREASI